MRNRSIPAYKYNPSQRDHVSVSLIFRLAFLLGIIGLAGCAVLKILLG